VERARAQGKCHSRVNGESVNFLPEASMSDDIVIRVENLGKKYQVGRNVSQDRARYRSVHENLMMAVRSLFQQQPAEANCSI
jgi:hypothetical protein